MKTRAERFHSLPFTGPCSVRVKPLGTTKKFVLRLIAASMLLAFLWGATGNNAVKGNASVFAATKRAPTVSVTSPTDGAAVSGTITVTANASPNGRIASVQFQLDGANVGSLDVAAPYAYSWDTTKSSNGSHTQQAIAEDTAGNSTTSAGVTVTVNNTIPDTTPPVVSDRKSVV